ncbi:MliC family protein [Treponema pectinovorum]|uniref:MliC family protein n=1 Tax=Treponema pectinovorum TaxID=164 RepID=UPI0011C9C595|nr:MliC family protein [Treponema pectinovorum]
MKKIMFIALSLIVFSLLSCSKAEDKSLKAVVTNSGSYVSSDGNKVVAVFYELSDKSLDFVKVKLGDKEFTLPHAVSADGARYSDEIENEFWFKGNSLFVFEKNDAGEWIPLKEYIEKK